MTRALALLWVLAGLLAGCGDDDKAQSTSTPAPKSDGSKEIEDRELDGTPAKTYSYQRREKENGKVRQRQVVAVKDDAIYTITWSVAADDFEAQEAILDTWRWS